MSPVHKQLLQELSPSGLSSSSPETSSWAQQTFPGSCKWECCWKLEVLRLPSFWTEGLGGALWCRLPQARVSPLRGGAAGFVHKGEPQSLVPWVMQGQLAIAQCGPRSIKVEKRQLVWKQIRTTAMMLIGKQMKKLKRKAFCFWVSQRMPCFNSLPFWCQGQWQLIGRHPRATCGETETSSVTESRCMPREVVLMQGQLWIFRPKLLRQVPHRCCLIQGCWTSRLFWREHLWRRKRFEAGVGLKGDTGLHPSYSTQSQLLAQMCYAHTLNFIIDF